jgi:delta-aminolevulinic acid dehydratase/porphobilinogen synthase
MSYAIDVIAVATGPVAAFAVSGVMPMLVAAMAHAIAQETMRLKSFLCFKFPMLSSPF